ncbi:hypothetical protein ACF09E_34755 [Streptomyces sp. NPDC014891]|uniref:hypothetical protein n=1 Tax=Streptomyces sp. NPDC014891 TaxID=3364929 RepID=UPI0036F4BBB3
MPTTFGPLLLDDEAGTQLRPAFDAVLRTFTVELWRDGRVAAVHGDNGEFFETARATTDALADFLTAHDVRPLTETESYELYGGLLRVKGGTGFELLIRQDARRS